MSEVEYIVCDKCGNVQVQALGDSEKWTCPVCQSEDGWLFADRNAAFNHGALITERVRQSA